MHFVKKKKEEELERKEDEEVERMQLLQSLQAEPTHLYQLEHLKKKKKRRRRKKKKEEEEEKVDERKKMTGYFLLSSFLSLSLKTSVEFAVAPVWMWMNV